MFIELWGACQRNFQLCIYIIHNYTLNLYSSYNIFRCTYWEHSYTQEVMQDIRLQYLGSRIGLLSLHALGRRLPGLKVTPTWSGSPPKHGSWGSSPGRSHRPWAGIDHMQSRWSGQVALIFFNVGSQLLRTYRHSSRQGLRRSASATGML